MGARDYAVIVGIQRYPLLDRGDLRGPDADSEAVRAWLTDPAGGAVPSANIRVYRSAAYPNPFPKGRVAPKRGDVIGAFGWLDGIAQTRNAAGDGLTVGDRLYVYVGGHGFGSRRAQASVFMADATPSRPWCVDATGWVEWLSNSMYFSECVLWVDCCMWTQGRGLSGVIGFRHEKPVPTPPAPKIFEAFAARWPSLAVESPMDDGQVHGAFTWTLLKGLRGAAADPATAQVSTGPLRAYLTNAMRTFMTAEQRADPSVSTEPDFGLDDDMLLATVPSSSSSVTLSFPPAAVGEPWHVVTGSPPVDVGAGTVRGGTDVLSLATGLYVARVESRGLSRGFEVAGVDLAVSVG